MSIPDLEPESYNIHKADIFLKDEELTTAFNTHVYNVAPFLLRSIIRIKRHCRNKRIKRLINRSLPQYQSFFYGFVMMEKQSDPDMYFEAKNKEFCFNDYAKLAYIKVIKEKEYLESLIHKIENNFYGKENF